MIVTPSTYAVLETHGKPIIFTDSQGKPCTFGHNHDECLYQHLEKIPGTTNYIDYHSGFKVGLHDGFNDGIYHHEVAEKEPYNPSWADGYTHGWGKGCVNSGRTSDDCDSQEDANTP